MKDERFVRTRLLFGAKGMERLSKARITVAGLGAVGSYAVEGLARAGVGNLRLVDFDSVHQSNINRQLYALDSTLGRLKVDVAKQRVLDINPACNVETQVLFIDEVTAPEALDPVPDILIDAIDSLSPKVDLLASAIEHKVPLIVSSMGAATRTDPSCIRVADISATRECPLAKFVRRKLKKRGIETGIKCVFSVELPGKNVNEGEALEENDPTSYERGRKRKPLGSFSCLTGMFGLVAAREAVMALLQ